MALQTVQTITRPGFDLTATAVAADGSNGDSWVNTGSQLVAVINGSGAPITVTENYNSTIKFDGATPTVKTYSVPAGHTAILGPFSVGYFSDATTQQAKISYSSATSVSVCVFQLGNA